MEAAQSKPGVRKLHPAVIDFLDKYFADKEARDVLAAHLATMSEVDQLLWWWEIQWRNIGRLPQQAPDGDWWTIHMWMAGRGWGKTKTGANDIALFAAKNRGVRCGVMGQTFSDTRDICFEGESGILNEMPYDLRKICTYNRTLLELHMPWNGSTIKGYSAEKPESLRGPQHHRFWSDEFAAWQYGQECLDQILFGLRLGRHPRLLITTTPSPTPHLVQLVKEAAEPNSSVSIIKGATKDNIGNLSRIAIERLEKKYAGTRLGRQELEAELLTDVPGALWSIDQLHRFRVAACPRLVRCVVGLDPSISSGSESDEAGIVVAGEGEDGHGYVKFDRTVSMAKPKDWAKAAVLAYKQNGANAIIAEVNQGGEMVRTIIHQEDPNVKVVMVHASHSKVARAEPVSMLYEQGLIHHVGVLAKLEDQMTTYVPGTTKKSPDRMDALVWALTHLFIKEKTRDISIYEATRSGRESNYEQDEEAGHDHNIGFGAVY